MVHPCLQGLHLNPNLETLSPKSRSRYYGAFERFIVRGDDLEARCVSQREFYIDNLLVRDSFSRPALRHGGLKREG